jgi:hypothetical protein
MIDELLRELSETWGYETEELNDIREKMEELANSFFLEGYNERCEEVRKSIAESSPTYSHFYGKKEDMEFYD